jgi:hypothetical protein
VRREHCNSEGEDELKKSGRRTEEGQQRVSRSGQEEWGIDCSSLSGLWKMARLAT